MTTPINAYDATIPQPDDELANSQEDMLENFQSLTQIFGVDHIAINNATNAGKHRRAQLLTQSQSPNTIQNQFNVYTKLDENNVAQAFIRPIGNAPEMQYTQYQIYPSNQNDSFSTLPGDFIIDFGVLEFGLPSIQIQMIPAVKKILGCWFMTDASGATPITESNWFPQVIAANKINLFYKGLANQTPPSKVFYLIIGKLGAI